MNIKKDNFRFFVNYFASGIGDYNSDSLKLHTTIYYHLRCM